VCEFPPFSLVLFSLYSSGFTVSIDTKLNVYDGRE